MLCEILDEIIKTFAVIRNSLKLWDQVALYYIHDHQAVSAKIAVLDEDDQEKEMFTIPVDTPMDFGVSYVDSHGNPAKVEGAPVWSSSDEAVLTVAPRASDPSGFTVTATPVGPIGMVQLKVVADADLGAGVTEVITLGDAEVVAGEAVSGVIAPVAP